VRSGEASALRQIETKAMSAGTNADGGYLVPSELEHEISGLPRFRRSAPSPRCARFPAASTKSRS
jgi:HK97 family phage major capsid protein